MVKTYKHIFFDLDRTIWDFDRNSRESTSELFRELNLSDQISADFDTFYKTLELKNRELWKEYRADRIDKEELRISRFTETFFALGSDDWKTARKMSSRYLEICPIKPHLVEGALEVLNYLNEKYKLHMITNGFSESQWRKIKSSGIEQYFNQIIISEETPYRKPMRNIFLYAMERAGASSSASIMIGDDIIKDILGAKKSSMDQIYYNALDKGPFKIKPTYEIKKLREILDLL